MRLIDDPAAWDDLLLRLPAPHLLQSWAWGAFKQRYGWSAERFAWFDAAGAPQAAAQLLRRRGPAGLSLLYCPRGPALDWSDAAARTLALSDLAAHAARTRAVALKIDPAILLARQPAGAPAPIPVEGGRPACAALEALGYRRAQDQVQFRNTLTLDLRQTEEELLAAMKQKTRYNLRLAERHGVHTRPADEADLPALYRLYAETALRDRFTIRHQAYYLDVWGGFMRQGLAQAFAAEHEGRIVAGLVLYRFGPTAWYLYGMSAGQARQHMPNHLLQWEAILWARAAGCTVYDFWGAPDRLDPADPLWGVYRFKQGFGAEMVMTPGAWDHAPRRLPYLLYTLVLPRLMALLRLRGRAQTRQALEA